MEPRIQYAQTKDGVSIAFCTLGEGMPLVHMPIDLALSHIQLEWRWPASRRWYERLAEKRTVVRYDGRGCGLSDRDVTDYSLDALVQDLEAVVDRLGSERISLAGSFDSGPPAIAYAARHSERVSHLLLWCTYARGPDAYGAPEAEAWSGLIDKEWKTFTETVAHAILGWSDSEVARWYAALMREATTPEAAQAMFGPIREVDVTQLLPRVKSPTLVLIRRSAAWPPANLTRDLASRISGAELVVMEGTSPVPFLGDTDAVLRAIDEFLGEGEETPAQAGMLPEGMAVILFTDIAGSTALTERLGDAAFRAKARELDERLRSVIREAGGTPVEGKVLGDGVMAVFTSARQAIDGAIRCNAAAQDTGLELHLGVHAGDVIREGNTVYGGAVNIAARIAGASAPGEILVSDTVRSLARTSAGVVFDDRGEHTLKGIKDSVRLYEVRWREA